MANYGRVGNYLVLAPPWTAKYSAQDDQEGCEAGEEEDGDEQALGMKQMETEIRVKCQREKDEVQSEEARWERDEERRS